MMFSKTQLFRVSLLAHILDKNKLSNKRSMEQLRKTVKQWGINKAKRDVFSVSKIDSKLILKSAGKLYKEKFTQKTKKHKTPYFNI